MSLLSGETFTPKVDVVLYDTSKVKAYSENPEVATIDENGVITAIEAGFTNIKYEATDGSGVSAALQVLVDIKLKADSVTLTTDQQYKQTITIIPTNTVLNCSAYSSKPEIATVDDNGIITAVGVGEADIMYSATNDSVVWAICHVTVYPKTTGIQLSATNINLTVSDTYCPQIAITPADAQPNLKVSSSNSKVATVNTLGNITAVGVGETYITYEATDGSGVSATCHVKVYPKATAIRLSTTTMSLQEGSRYTQQIVTVEPEDIASDVKIDISSDDESVAAVDESGNIRAKTPGIATITYSITNPDSSIVSAACRVIVYDSKVIYVGGLSYLFKGDAATVTNIYGGYHSMDTTAIAQYYSGTINIPKSVTYNGTTYTVSQVGAYAFFGQNRLQSLYIPASVISVEERAASMSESLQLVSVEDESQMESIGYRAFMDCTGLLRFTFNGTSLNLQKIGESAFQGCTGLQRIRWIGESSLREIDDYAFNHCTSLNHLTMPNSVTRIGKHSFRYDESLNDITLADSLSLIDEYAFGECGFSHITLPGSLASAQAGAFINNDYLTEITIPASMEGIGAACFENNKTLETVTFLTSIHTMTIGNNAFNLCPSLNRVNIAHIDSWAETNFNNAKANPANTAHHIFVGDKEIEDVVLPEGTMYVNNNAFNGCTAIKSVDMPSTIDHINDDIFTGCDSLTKVTCRATEVPLFIGVNDPAAMNDVFRRATLYVPQGSLEDYRADSWWRRFSVIEEEDPIGISFARVNEPLDVHVSKSNVTLTSREDRVVRITSASGVVVSNVFLSAGKDKIIRLLPGTYIIGKRKIVIR